MKAMDQYVCPCLFPHLIFLAFLGRSTKEIVQTSKRPLEGRSKVERDSLSSKHVWRP